MLAAQGFDVVCATISLFHSVQRWNRANIPNYFEIYLRVPFEELTRRDSKGIYSHALGGASNVVGLDISMEEPETPDLVLENYGDIDPYHALETVWRQIVAPPRNASARGARSAQFRTKAENSCPARAPPALRPRPATGALYWGKFGVSSPKTSFGQLNNRTGGGVISSSAAAP